MSDATYFNRELALLDFQERVLALAEDSDTPLLERVKFVAIVTQNLDEFFQVRVAGLQEQVLGGVTSASPDGLTPSEQLATIRPRVSELEERRDRLFLDELMPQLRRAGIEVIQWSDTTADEREWLHTFFEDRIFPVLTPLAFDPSHPFPFISNLSLNLAVVLRDPETGSLRFARIKLPPILSRFIRLPGGERFLPLEHVVAAHLDWLFPGVDAVHHSPFRITRNAELAVEEEEADDLLEAMESVLQYRQRAARAVRLEIAADMNDSVLALLTSELQLGPHHVYSREAPLGLGGLFELYGLDRPELKDPPWVPATQHRLAERGEIAVDFFEAIRTQDILVHHPYDSFHTSTGAFLAQAAADPNVLAIKQTLYRTSVPDDPARGGERTILRSLMTAAQSGKQVVVLIELKARFDEEANINWARMLESAGVHVVYGVQDLKTHSKILMVVRREGEALARYSHIGTGNYNPKTARIYEDIGLFTADPIIGADLSRLFNVLTGFSRNMQYDRLLIAPRYLRRRLVERIREEAALGPDGHIMWKINHLIDPEVIDELYAASRAGCPIDLIVRGMNGIRAGVAGLSETITVRSIVGEFLEHSRIYRFGRPERGAVYYLGSADMMQRNLDRRVETLVPVTDPRLQARLEEILHFGFGDDVLAWELGPDDAWRKRTTEKGVNLHQEMKRLAGERSRSV